MSTKILSEEILMKEFKEVLFSKFDWNKAKKAVETIYGSLNRPIPNDVVVVDDIDLTLFNDKIIGDYIHGYPKKNYIHDLSDYLDISSWEYKRLNNFKSGYLDTIEEDYYFEFRENEEMNGDDTYNTIDDLLSLPIKHRSFFIPTQSISRCYQAFHNLRIIKSYTPTTNLGQLESEAMLAVMEAGIFGIFVGRTYCIIVKNPIMHINKRGFFHNANGPAIQFAKSKFYMYEGQDVPKRWITAPKSLTSKEIRAITNAEDRMMLIKIIGAQKFFETAGEGHIDVWDKAVDNQGNEMELFDVEIGENGLRVLKCTCPSKKETYYLCPPNQDTTDVWEAKGSTFGISGIECRQMLMET